MGSDPTALARIDLEARAPAPARCRAGRLDHRNEKPPPADLLMGTETLKRAV